MSKSCQGKGGERKVELSVRNSLFEMKPVGQPSQVYNYTATLKSSVLDVLH